MFESSSPCSCDELGKVWLQTWCKKTLTVGITICELQLQQPCISDDLVMRDMDGDECVDDETVYHVFLS